MVLTLIVEVCILFIIIQTSNRTVVDF